VIRAARARGRAGALVLLATASVDIALNISDAVAVHDGASWRLIDRAACSDLASISGLSASSVASFLAGRGLTGSGVRRFRDAVLRAS
jgi:hypothetical protein